MIGRDAQLAAEPPVGRRAKRGLRPGRLGTVAWRRCGAKAERGQPAEVDRIEREIAVEAPAIGGGGKLHRPAEGAVTDGAVLPGKRQTGSGRGGRALEIELRPVALPGNGETGGRHRRGDIGRRRRERTVERGMPGRIHQELAGCARGQPGEIGADGGVEPALRHTAGVDRDVRTLVVTERAGGETELARQPGAVGRIEHDGNLAGAGPPVRGLRCRMQRDGECSRAGDAIERNAEAAGAVLRRRDDPRIGESRAESRPVAAEPLGNAAVRRELAGDEREPVELRRLQPRFEVALRGGRRETVNAAAGDAEAGAAQIAHADLDDLEHIVGIAGVDDDVLRADVVVLEGAGGKANGEAVGERAGIDKIGPEEKFTKRSHLTEIDAVRLEIGAEFAALLAVLPPGEAPRDAGITDAGIDVADGNAARTDLRVAGDIEGGKRLSRRRRRSTAPPRGKDRRLGHGDVHGAGEADLARRRQLAVRRQARLTGQARAEAADLPPAGRRRRGEGDVLHYRSTNHDRRHAEGDAPGHGERREASERRHQTLRGVGDIDGRGRPTAERAIEVELPRLDGSVEGGLLAEIERERTGDARRPVRRAVRDDCLVDDDAFARQGEAPPASPAGGLLPAGAALGWLAGVGGGDGIDGLADIVGPGVADAGVRCGGEHAIGGHGNRPPRRAQIALHPDGAVGEPAPRGETEGHGLVAVAIAAIDAPRTVERTRLHRRGDPGKREGHAGRRVGVFQCPVPDRDIGEGDAVGRDRFRRSGALQPIGHAVVVDGDLHLRRVERHRDHVNLALEERDQLDRDGEAVDRHQRRGGIADLDVGEGQRRRGQNGGVGGAEHVHRMAEDARGLQLEARLEVVPVDEPRHDQRREQHRDDGAADDQVEPVQGRLRRSLARGSAAFFITARRSCRDS